MIKRNCREYIGFLGKRNMIVMFLAIFFIAESTMFGEVKVQKEKDTIAILIDGEEFTRYNYGEGKFPYFYPLREPGGANVTRHWPMEDIGEGEAHDHPHHKSLWFTHGAVNGVDFWHRKGRIVQTEVVSLESGKEKGLLETENEWRKSNGDVVCTDTRKYVFTGGKDFRAIDIRIALKASQG